MKPDYRIFLDMDSYSVYDANGETPHIEFSGSLADCEAWIRLKEADKI